MTLVTAAGLATPPGVRRVDVESAQQMYDSVLALAASADIVVMAAAVADFRPVVVCAEKLKKRDGVPTVQLEPTPDILAALGATKRPGQTIVGFAAETQDVATNALDKLARKGADLIVANDVSAPGVGFEHETNQVTVLGADGHRVEIPLASKRAIARRVIDEVVALRTSHTRETTP